MRHVSNQFPLPEKSPSFPYFGVFFGCLFGCVLASQRNEMVENLHMTFFSLACSGLTSLIV